MESRARQRLSRYDMSIISKMKRITELATPNDRYVLLYHYALVSIEAQGNFTLQETWCRSIVTSMNTVRKHYSDGQGRRRIDGLRAKPSVNRCIMYELLDTEAKVCMLRVNACPQSKSYMMASRVSISDELAEGFRS